MSLLGKSFQKLNSFTGGNIIKVIANKLIQDFGELNELQIDKQTKMISGEILLRGENSPIAFSLNYEITTDSRSYFITIVSARIEREWLNTLANRFLIGKNQEVSASKFSLIADLLI